MDKIPNTDDSIRLRHIQRQNQHKRIMKRRRITLYTVLTAIAVIIIIFFTPLFNIKNIEIVGNSRIETAQIKQAVGSVEEDNLFRLNKKKIIENVKTIPYINDLQIKKRIFPTGLKIIIDECKPVGYVLFNEAYIILDSNMKVLEVSPTGIENISEISGIGVVAANEGAVISVDDNDKLGVISECLSVLINEELISNITSINFTDMNNIVFKYENRLDVVCGSDVDFSKKIGILKKAVNSSRLQNNARGTIDLSIMSGKAIYTP